jgi:hypothetical protein
MRISEKEILAELVHLLDLPEFTRAQILAHLRIEWGEMWETFRIKALNQELN